METGIITPTIHFKQPRQNLSAIIEGKIKIVTEPTEWEGGYVGINSFGFGGVNCHILLKPNSKKKINNGVPNDNISRLVVASGRTEEAVKIILEDVSKYCNVLFYLFINNFNFIFIFILLYYCIVILLLLSRGSVSHQVHTMKLPISI